MMPLVAETAQVNSFTFGENRTCLNDFQWLAGPSPVPGPVGGAQLDWQTYHLVQDSWIRSIVEITNNDNQIANFTLRSESDLGSDGSTNIALSMPAGAVTANVTQNWFVSEQGPGGVGDPLTGWIVNDLAFSFPPARYISPTGQGSESVIIEWDILLMPGETVVFGVVGVLNANSTLAAEEMDFVFSNLNTILYFGTTPAQTPFNFASISSPCGNSILDANEECDDGNTMNGDGCSFATCSIETDFVCVNDPLPSVCSRCGNSVVDMGEECDDANTESGDGCSFSDCTVEPGFTCTAGDPSVCTAISGASFSSFSLGLILLGLFNFLF